MDAIDPLYSVCGFVGGLLVGMTGVGGGSLMTPLLILLFGVHPATAVGTDLLFAAATKTGGSLVHGLARTIDWTVVRRLASGSVPSTVLTLLVLSRFDVNGAAMRDLITTVLSVALFVTAGLLIYRRKLLTFYAARAGELSARRTTDVSVGGGAGRAGVDLLGRRRRHRRHSSNPALSPPSHGEDRRLRHRPCGALDVSRRARTLDAGLGRLAHIRLAAGGLVAGHLPRQLPVGPRRRTCAPDHSRAHPCSSGKQARLRADTEPARDHRIVAKSVRSPTESTLTASLSLNCRALVVDTLRERQAFPCLGSVSGQCAELLGALSGILVSLGHDLFAAVGADDGRVTTQACGGAREMIAAARTDHLDLDFVFPRLLRHRFASGRRPSVPRPR